MLRLRPVEKPENSIVQVFATVIGVFQQQPKARRTDLVGISGQALEVMCDLIVDGELAT